MTLSNTSAKQAIQYARNGSLKDLGDVLDYLVDSDDLYVSGVEVTATAAELNTLAGVTAGTVTASKGVVVDANKDISAFRTVGVVNLDAGSSGAAGTVDVFPSTAAMGKLTLAAVDNDGDTTTTISNAAMAQASVVSIPDPGAATANFLLTDQANDQSLVNASAAELNRVADVSARIVALSGAESITLAAHDGKTLTMGTTDVNATLPAATGTGARLRFVVTGVPATTSHTIACAGTDEFNGHCIQTDVDTSDTLASYPALVGDDFDLFTMNGTTQGGLVGDVIELEDVASGVWAIKAFINSSGAVASPFSTS